METSKFKPTSSYKVGYSFAPCPDFASATPQGWKTSSGRGILFEPVSILPLYTKSKQIEKVLIYKPLGPCLFRSGESQ